MKQIYLDYAAATPLDADVQAAMQPFIADQFYNPSATYLAAKAVNKQITSARERVARTLGARPTEIIFTAGGTEANNLAIHGVMQQFPDGNIVVSQIEHDSVLLPAGRYDVRLAPVTSQGLVDVDKLTSLIDDKTVLVSVMYANNEVGIIQPLKQIASRIAGIRSSRRERPLYFHTDACQAPNYLQLAVAKLGVDMLTLNASKLYGPKQCGALYVKTGTRLSPQILGGGQERGMRSGTENVAGIIGLAAALDKAQQLRESEVKRLGELRSKFVTLLTLHIPNIVITITAKQILPNNIHVYIPGQDNELLLMELDERGVQCAAGSACSASNEEPSHVLKAMGINEQDAQSSLRFTMGRGTTLGDVEYTVKALKDILS